MKSIRLPLSRRHSGQSLGVLTGDGVTPPSRCAGRFGCAPPPGGRSGHVPARYLAMGRRSPSCDARRPMAEAIGLLLYLFTTYLPPIYHLLPEPLAESALLPKAVV